MPFWDRKNKDIENIDILTNKKSNIPILTLDKNWHYMFPPGKKTEKMISIEKELNNLLKEQGNLNNKYREYKGLKKECMNEIVSLMEAVYDNEDKLAQENMSRSQRYVEDINYELEQIEQRLEAIPKMIRNVNNQLLNESVKMCYSEMKSNRRRLKQLEIEIESLREKLRDRIEEKAIKEEMVERTYTFLHNMVGADVLDMLDRQNLE